MGKPEPKGTNRNQAYAIVGGLIALAAVVGAGLYIIGRSTPAPATKQKPARKTTPKKSAK